MNKEIGYNDQHVRIRTIAKDQHVYNRINAFRFLEKLKDIGTPQAQFYYLRNLDAFVFEEMILTCLKRKGFIIVRNDGYTGDGGVDGRAYYKDQHYLIQAKRYTGHIKANDVKDFAKICKRRKGKGLFVHTGKTGDTAKEAAKECGMEIVSGVRLLELLLTEPPEDQNVIKLCDIANKAFNC
jgi:restriction system protein